MTYDRLLFWLPLMTSALMAIICVQALVPLRDPRWRALAAAMAMAVIGRMAPPGLRAWP